MDVVRHAVDAIENGFFAFYKAPDVSIEFFGLLIWDGHLTSLCAYNDMAK